MNDTKRTRYTTKLDLTVAQLLWEVAFNDDDIAQGLCDMFVKAGCMEWLAKMGDTYSEEQVRLILHKERAAVHYLLDQEEWLADRLKAYMRPDPVDDIPF